jgi:hypothetical protein
MEKTESSTINKTSNLKALGVVLFIIGLLLSISIVFPILFYHSHWTSMVIQSGDFVLMILAIQMEIVGLALIMSQRKNS